MSFERFHNEYDDGTQVEIKESKVKLCCKFYRRKIIIVSIIAALLIITGSVLIWYFTNLDQIPQFEEMERDMDKKVDPCNDFYEYSCGNYIKKNLAYTDPHANINKNKFLQLQGKNVEDAKEALEAMAKTSDPVFKMAYSYYDTCMKGARNMDLYWAAAADIGGSEITNKSFNLSLWNSDDALYKMKKLYNANPLFNVEVGTDLLNSSRNIIMIKPPDSGLLGKLTLEDYLQGKLPKYPGYVLEEDADDYRTWAYNFRTNIQEVFTAAAGAKIGQSHFYVKDILNQALEVESDIINDIEMTLKGKQPHEIYKKVTVSYLNNMTNNAIDWIKILRGITSGNSSVPVTDQTVVGLMVTSSYLERIGVLMAKSYTFGRRRLPNFFSWFLLKKLSPALPNDYFAAYYFNAKGSVVGKSGKEKWRACMLDTELRMPLTIGMMFTKKVISNQTSNEITKLLGEVKTAFYNGVDSVPWLDSKTRIAVREKLNYLLYIIANPNMVNSSSLQMRYKEVTVRTDNLGEFFLSCVRNLVNTNVMQLEKAVSRKRIDQTTAAMKLYDVNAFYDRSKNRIMILAGILRSPFFYNPGPSYINFGKIVSILGHELLHGYDSLGWYYDGTGQIAPWWTKSAADAFANRTYCVRLQYDDYKWGGYSLNGYETLPENIADNGGLKYAYLAYKSWAKTIPNEKKPAGLKKLSYDQLFFLAYAQMWCQAASHSVKEHIINKDTHSPSKFRVIGSVSNFEPFSRAYRCARGSKMNPVKKCLVW